MSDLDAFVAFDKKADFIGIFHGGKCVGYVSSGGYSHHVKKSMAMGYVPMACATNGSRMRS